jgi:hypothetical protein
MAMGVSPIVVIIEEDGKVAEYRKYIILAMNSF